MANKGQEIHRSTKADIRQRRQMVRGFLQKSVRSPTAISSQLGDKWPVYIIENDIRYIMKSAWEWVDEQAMFGFVSDVKLAIEELQNIELTLQDIIQDKNNLSWIRINAIRTKVTCINSRLDLQGRGPMMMRLKKASSIISKQHRVEMKADAK